MDNINWQEKIDKFRLPIGLAIVGIVLIIGGIFASSVNKQKPQYPQESIVSSAKQISVDVSGAVNKPGVYQLKEGSRIEDAIAAAGGFSSSANGEYISKYFNMAQLVSDGSKIYVPVSGENGPAVQSGVAGANTRAKININTASQVDLEALPGIGPVTAAKIISDRPYSKIEDLLSLKVVFKSTFEKIKDLIVVY